MFENIIYKNQISKCRVCGSNALEQYLDLNVTPWCNGILKEEDIQNEKQYPLRLAFCHNCTASNLLDTIPKEDMFSRHTYVSGTTKTLSEHFLNIAKDVTTKFNIKKDDLIVDIGGNDGTNLLQYEKLGFKNSVNIESASNIAEISINNGITTVTQFFNKSCINKYYMKYNNIYFPYLEDQILQTQQLRDAKVINASGVFFHLEELHSVCEGIENLLTNDGIFVVQFMYIDDIIKKLQFDSIYHEHLLFYTKLSLITLLEKYNLYPIEFYHSDIHGGSQIAYFSKKKTNYHIEENLDLYKIDLYKDFGEKVAIYKDKLYYLLLDITRRGFKINMYGVPAKSTTLLNYCNIGKFIDVAEEANSMKCGYLTSGTHIPIVHYSEIKERPKYYLITSWNFLKEFIQKEIKYLEDDGNFIIPFPNEPFIINRENYREYL